MPNATEKQRQNILDIAHIRLAACRHANDEARKAAVAKLEEQTFEEQESGNLSVSPSAKAKVIKAHSRLLQAEAACRKANDAYQEIVSQTGIEIDKIDNGKPLLRYTLTERSTRRAAVIKPFSEKSEALDAAYAEFREQLILSGTNADFQTLFTQFLMTLEKL